jgi:hypothetical protein
MKIRFIILIIASIALISTACTAEDKGLPKAEDAQPGAVPDLVGSYVVNGFDPLGTEYSGHLTIRAGEQPGEYWLQWIVVGSIQEGQGFLEGNQLTVQWQSVEGMLPTQGDAVYTITTAKELYGTKTVRGFEGEGDEIAFPND